MLLKTLRNLLRLSLSLTRKGGRDYFLGLALWRRREVAGEPLRLYLAVVSASALVLVPRPRLSNSTTPPSLQVLRVKTCCTVLTWRFWGERGLVVLDYRGLGSTRTAERIRRTLTRYKCKGLPAVATTRRAKPSPDHLSGSERDAVGGLPQDWISPLAPQRGEPVTCSITPSTGVG